MEQVSRKKMRELWFLNNDVSFEVLSRLLTKPLLKLKCVSKEWRQLISDRTFIRFQLKRTEPLSGFLFQERLQWCEDDINTHSYIPINIDGNKVKHNILEFLPESIVMLSSINGLICCRSCFSSRVPQIYVCNPTNKTCVSFPFPDNEIGNYFSLDFDPFRDPTDDSINFNVVGVRQTETDMDDCLFSFYIFSSEAREWRISRETCQWDCNLLKKKGICTRGVLYWLTDADRVLMFDLKKELSWLIKTPLLSSSQFNTIAYISMCIGESEGKLHLASISEDGLQLWVVEDHFSSVWTLKHSISLEKLEEENSQFFYHLKEKVTRPLMNPWVDPLAFKDEELFLRVSSDIYLYNFKMRNMVKLCSISDLGPNSMFSPTVLPYTLSLVPLGSA